MLVAVSTSEDGRKLLVLGLTEENIDRLKNDEPIFKNLGQDLKIPSLEIWDISILGPEDTARFMAHYRIKAT